MTDYNDPEAGKVCHLIYRTPAQARNPHPDEYLPDGGVLCASEVMTDQITADVTTVTCPHCNSLREWYIDAAMAQVVALRKFYLTGDRPDTGETDYEGKDPDVADDDS